MRLQLLCTKVNVSIERPVPPGADRVVLEEPFWRDAFAATAGVAQLGRNFLITSGGVSSADARKSGHVHTYTPHPLHLFALIKPRRRGSVSCAECIVIRLLGCTQHRRECHCRVT